MQGDSGLPPASSLLNLQMTVSHLSYTHFHTLCHTQNSLWWHRTLDKASSDMLWNFVSLHKYEEAVVKRCWMTYKRAEGPIPHRPVPHNLPHSLPPLTDMRPGDHQPVIQFRLARQSLLMLSLCQLTLGQPCLSLLYYCCLIFSHPFLLLHPRQQLPPRVLVSRLEIQESLSLPQVLVSRMQILRSLS